MRTTTSRATAVCVLRRTFEMPQVCPKHPLFAVGDVHGLAEPFKCALQAGQQFLRRSPNGRVVLLGDLIDRGPDTAGVLKAMARFVKMNGDRVIPLAGNHESLMFGSLYEGDRARAAEYQHMWEHAGGAWGFRPNLNETRRFLESHKLGLPAWRSHYVTGNVLCVHAGIAPHVSSVQLGAFLAQPILYRPPHSGGSFPHWAWVRDEFLEEDCPLPGGFVVHGHTHRDFDMTPRPGRFNADAGSFKTGRIAAAELSPGKLTLHIWAQET